LQPAVGEKIPEFSKIFQSHNYTFPEVIATKILVIWQHSGRFLKPYFHSACAETAISADIYWAGSHYSLPEIVKILFTQSTVVLRQRSIILKSFYLL